MILSFARQLGRTHCTPRCVGAISFVIVALLGTFAAIQQSRDNTLEATKSFDAMSRRILEQVQHRMQIYKLGTIGARSAVLAVGNEQLSRSAFERSLASRDVDREFPGSRGIGLIRRVPVGEESQFRGTARRDGYPDFTIRQLAPHAHERFVIQYIEPVKRNRQAVGLDIASETNRRTAAIASARSGKATLTAPITLVQASGKSQRSFLLLLPMYASGAALGTESQREAATIGWTYMPLLMDEVMRGINNFDGQIWLSLSDTEDMASPPFFTTAGTAPDTTMFQQFSIDIFGRPWRVDFYSTPKFHAALHQSNPNRVFTGGLLLAALCGLLAWLAMLSWQRERQRRIDQTRRAAFVELAGDAIIGETLDGVITDWNTGAARLFGYSTNEAIGQNVKQLLLSEANLAEYNTKISKIRQGDVAGPFYTMRRDKSGDLIDISLMAAPIFDASQQVSGVSTILRDNREAKRNERAVRELNRSLEQQVLERTSMLDATRHELQHTLDALPSVVAYWDDTLTCRFANKIYDAWYGINPIGRHASEIADGLLNQFLPRMQAALRGEMQRFEATIPRISDSGERHLLVNYVPNIYDGQVLGFHAIITDISQQTLDRGQLKKALRDNEAMLSTLNQHALVSVADRHGTILDANPAFCEISGYSRDELIGQNHRLVNSGVQDRTFWIDMWRTIASGKPWRGEICNRAKDGSLYWVDSIIAPFRGNDGRIEKFISIRTDISARKRSQMERTETLTLLKNVLESASEVSIIATDPEMNIRVFNAGAERLLGYRRDEIVGIATPAMLHDADEMAARAEELATELGRTIQGGEVFTAPETLQQSREWTYLRKDGSRVTVSLVVTAMRSVDGTVFGYLGVAHDVTRQKQVEQSLREAMHKEKKANQAKSQFLANMSHEIRTPMNAVMGLTFLLDQTPLNPEQAAFLNKIRLSSKSLLTVINDVLDLSKIEAGELKIDNAPFSLRTLLHDVSEVISVQADGKNIHFSIDAPAEMPAAVEGDCTRLNQILTNLLSNAIKFTDRGSVKLEVRWLAATTQGVKLRFSVRDTGIGIAPDFQARLFAPFAQADASTTRRFGGSGLGLSIVKHMVSLMGGELGLSSTPGVGSEFWVELTFGMASREALEQAQNDFQSAGTQDVVGIRVLVVDDSTINLEVAKRILERQGAVITLANNGREAVDCLSAQPDGFDVVLMDVQMPVMDGHEATRRIRGELGLTKLPIIALTAGALTSEHERARSAGMSDFISKPFDATQLVRSVRRHARGTADLAPAPTTAAGHPIPADWPRIEGVDAGESYLRLGGDVSLFQAMLRRLLDEYADLNTTQTIHDTSEWASLANRLHKLRGSAGLLGVTTIPDLAKEAETACRGSDPALAAPLLTSVAEQLEILRQHAGPMLAQADADEHTAVTPQTAEAMDPQQFAALQAMLQDQNLGALELFAALTPHLRGRLGKEEFLKVREQINNLQFNDAADTLHKLTA